MRFLLFNIAVVVALVYLAGGRDAAPFRLFWPEPVAVASASHDEAVPVEQSPAVTSPTETDALDRGPAMPALPAREVEVRQEPLPISPQPDLGGPLPPPEESGIADVAPPMAPVTQDDTVLTPNDRLRALFELSREMELLAAETETRWPAR